MSKFDFKETYIKGLYVIEPYIHEDNRGLLKKTYEKNIFMKNNIQFDVVEEIETTSKRNTVRGLHFFLKNSQAKLIRVVRGGLFDVAVDLRSDSKTFGMYFAIELSESNKKMLYIPDGFAHGCLSLDENTTFYYLCSTKYNGEYDSGIKWNDKDLNISWPIKDYEKILLSNKDQNLMSFRDFKTYYKGL